MNKENLHGAGGGGGGSRSPTRTPDSLLSQDYVEILLALGEGPIKGLAPGIHSPSENFLVGDTPLVSASTGDANFADFNATFYAGADTDPAIELKMGGQSNNVPVNVRLASKISVVRQTPAYARGTMNRIEVRILFNQMVKTTDDGTFETDAVFSIEYRPSINGAQWQFYNGQPQSTIHGKTTSGAVKDFLIPVPSGSFDYDLRVTKISADNLQETGEDIVEMTWESFQCVTLGSAKYQDVALAHVYGKATNQFSSIPDFAGVYDGLIVKIPTNYNGTTRNYDGVIWTGVFKTGWTDNPFWVLYDLLTNPRYGLPRYYLDVAADRFQFYEAAQWADELVSNGAGGLQRRFSFNEVITEGKSGLELLQYVAGACNSIIIDDGNGVVSLKTDRPSDPTQIFTPENVTPEGFNYTFTDVSTRYNSITVSFINPDLDWAEDRRMATIDATSFIARNGLIPLDFIAIGCIDVHEAIRRANYRFVTANTECATVSFATTRFGLLTELFDTIYVADPDADWSTGGRIKGITGNVIQLRDPVYFPSTAPCAIRLQTFDGLLNLTITPPNAGICYSMIVTAGVAPSFDSLPDRTVFTVEDMVALGRAKPFRVLSIEEVEGSPDQIKITALEVNVYKYEDADAGSISDHPGYAPGMPGEPLLPAVLNLESGAAHTQIASDGTLIHRIYASWQRPVQAFTDYYELDYRETNGATWNTLRAYGDDTYVAPVKDGGEYDLRLFAVTPLGHRSRKAVERLGYLVGGKDGSFLNVEGLAIKVGVAGWEVAWTPVDKKIYPDYAGTELRQGTALTEWGTAKSIYRNSGQPVVLQWQIAGVYKLYAKHYDTSDNASAQAAEVDWIVTAPGQPIVNGEDRFGTVYLDWQDCTGAQPLSYYIIKVGDAFDTATEINRGNSTNFSRAEAIAGYQTYWVAAVDVAGNSSAPGYVKVFIYPTIDDAIADLQKGLDDAIAIIVAGAIVATDANSARVLTEIEQRRIALVEEAEARAGAILDLANSLGTAISEERQLRTTGDDQVAGLVTTLTAKVVADNATILAAVQNESQARSTADQAQATTTSTLAAQFRGAYTGTDAGQVTTGLISSVNQSIATKDAAQASRTDVLEAKVTNNDATVRGLITSESNTRASSDQSTATQLNALSATAGSNTASISQVSQATATVAGKVNATWSLSVTANGRVSGMMLGNDGGQSVVAFQVDKFAIAIDQYNGTVKYPFIVGTVAGVSTIGINGLLVVDGTILARHIQVNTLAAITANIGYVNSGQINLINYDNQGTNWIRSGLKNNLDGTNGWIFYRTQDGGHGFDVRCNASNYMRMSSDGTFIIKAGSFYVDNTGYMEITRLNVIGGGQLATGAVGGIGAAEGSGGVSFNINLQAGGNVVTDMTWNTSYGGAYTGFPSGAPANLICYWQIGSNSGNYQVAPVFVLTSPTFQDTVQGYYYFPTLNVKRVFSAAPGGVYCALGASRGGVPVFLSAIGLTKV